MFKFILKILGWKIIGAKNVSPKSVVTVAPHTSYLDGVIGYIAMKSLGINFKVISAEWLFFFPFKYIMKYVLHARPVGPNSGNAITASVKALNENDKCNLIICPEGHLHAINKLNKGFWLIAKKANVPIDSVTFNYKTKTIYIHNITSETYEGTINALYTLYRKFAYAKHPEWFKLI